MAAAGCRRAESGGGTDSAGSQIGRLSFAPAARRRDGGSAGVGRRCGRKAEQQGGSRRGDSRRRYAVQRRRGNSSRQLDACARASSVFGQTRCCRKFAALAALFLGCPKMNLGYSNFLGSCWSDFFAFKSANSGYCPIIIRQLLEMLLQLNR